MASQLRHCTGVLIVLIVVLHQVPEVKSKASLSFNVTSYTPPTFTDAQCCPDSTNNCSTTCKNVTFAICFSSSVISTCDLQPVQTFNSLPKTVYQFDSWTGSAYAVISAFCTTNSQSKLLDVFMFNYTASNLYTPDSPVTPGPNQIPIVSTLVGNNAKYPLSYSAQATCDPTYYGQYCNVTCEPLQENTCSGDYSCSPSDGNKVCRPSWTGADCNTPVSANCPANLTPSPARDNANCTAVDVVFVVYNSSLTSSQGQATWTAITTGLKAYVDRITLGSDQYQVGVVTFSSSAELAVPLQSNATSFKAAVDSIPFVPGSVKNPGASLFVTRTKALNSANGARPFAFQAVVFVWDGAQSGDLLTPDRKSVV